VATPSVPVPPWAELKTEVCSVCHPFFTGQQRIVDTGGQVERFQKRLTKSRATLK